MVDAGLAAPTLPTYSPGTYEIDLSRIRTGAVDATYADAYVEIVLNADGSGAYRYGDDGTATTNFTTFTWLPAGGSAGDFYGYMDAPTGDAFTSGNTTGASHQLSANRSWTLLAAVTVGTPGDSGSASATLTSTLRIKNSGGTDLIARTLVMDVSAAVGPP